MSQAVSGEEARASGGSQPNGSRPQPDSATLRLLGVIAGVTVACWLSARVACNRRDAPLREPRQLTDAELRSTAKSVAIEFAQRFAERRFEAAADFATGAAAAWVESQAQRCSTKTPPAKAADCEPLSSPHTRAVYLRPERPGALLRAEAHGERRVEVSELLVVRRSKSEGTGWVVAERREPSAAEAATQVGDAGAP